MSCNSPIFRLPFAPLDFLRELSVTRNNRASKPTSAGSDSVFNNSWNKTPCHHYLELLVVLPAAQIRNDRFQHWFVSSVSSFIRQWSRVHQDFYFNNSLHSLVGRSCIFNCCLQSFLSYLNR